MDGRNLPTLKQEKGASQNLLDSSVVGMPSFSRGGRKAHRKSKTLEDLLDPPYFTRPIRLIDGCLCHMMVMKVDPEYNNSTLFLSTVISIFIVIGNVGNQVHICNAGILGESRGQALERDHVRAALRLANSLLIKENLDRNSRLHIREDH